MPPLIDVVNMVLRFGDALILSKSDKWGHSIALTLCCQEVAVVRNSMQWLEVR